MRHLNVQKWSEPLNCLNFWPRHTGVHFFNLSTSKSGPGMVCFVHFDFETCFAPSKVRILTLLTWKCASHHNGVHFFDIWTSKSGPKMVCFAHFDLEMCFAPQRREIFMAHLTTWLRTCRFSEPTFRPSGVTNHWKKHGESRLSCCVFFLLCLSLPWSYIFFSSLLLPLPPLLFHLSILWEVWLLNFLRSFHL